MKMNFLSPAMKVTRLLVCTAFLFPLAVGAESVPPPSSPGIFGIGFTNVTDTSARLVFTTSEPMTTTVVVLDQDKEFARLAQPNFDEIHSVDLGQLTKGDGYHITITGITHDGQTVTSEDQILKPALHPPSNHAWPGYTIFSTSVPVSGPADLDLLAQSGARMARMEVSWSGVYPHNSTEINQAYLDRFVQNVKDLKSRNIEPLVVLDYCVPWAKPYTNTTMTWRNPGFGPPDRVADWETYLRTVVTALHGSAKYYEVWNEPDAGYFASGSFVERPDLPPPIARAPYKDNWNYWIGDRFAPMISSVRKVMDELQPDAVIMNGGWNRDYNGQRGDLLLERGVAPDLDVYAFHCYSAQPLSFSRWYGAIDGGFRKNIDRIFDKHHVQMPLAITEWGWSAWSDPQPGKGFVSFDDARKFFVKSSFYFLGLQRVEVLSQFCLGFGNAARDKDPSFYALVDKGDDGKFIYQPTFKTYQWLATTFGSKVYQALPLQVTPSDQVKAYAIQMKDSGDTYLAVWQDGVPDDKGAIAAQPARDVQVSTTELPDGNYSVQCLDLDGTMTSQSQVTASHGFQLKVTLPEISSTAESGIYLAKITAQK
jgi:hypothetical protein